MKRNKGKISFILQNKNRRISLQKIFSYGFFFLTLLTLITFSGCNGTTPPVNEEKLAVDLNTPDVEASIAGVTGNVTLLELANYNSKLMGVSLVDSLVDFGKINYHNMKDCAEEIGLNSFLGWYTQSQVRQSIKNGYPGITIQFFNITGSKAENYRLIDAFDDYGEFFKANDPYHGDDFKIFYSEWKKYNFGSEYAFFFIMYNEGEDPFKDFSSMPIEIEDWPEPQPDAN